MSFAALGLPGPIMRGVDAAGYTDPTPIQKQAIPLILEDHDVVAAAQTGSGKTAAFVLPILAHLLDGHRAVRALVLVPTRELAAQVETCARRYARFTKLSVGAVYGGVPIGPQERMIRNEGVDLLIATPGRLLDLTGRQSVALDEVEILVLDEADRMVDMGFAPDLKRILDLVPKNRQTLMFSATMPAGLNDVARKALHNPKRIEIAPPSRPAERIEQVVHAVDTHDKPDALHRILREAGRSKSIVFARTKHGADRIGRRLKTQGHRIAVLHGDRSQGQRERAMEQFRRGRMNVLVATDIASRGIDVDDVERVINYDVPRSPEDYVHRIGRTGRMNAVGLAITLMSPGEAKDVAAIEKSMGSRVPRAGGSSRANGAPRSHEAPRANGNGAPKSRSNGTSNGRPARPVAVASNDREPQARRPFGRRRMGRGRMPAAATA